MNAPEFDHSLHNDTTSDSWVKQHVPGGPRTIWIIVGLVVLGLLAWVILAPTSAPKTGRDAFGPGGPVPVGVAQATSGDIHVTLNALGAVTPLATVTVKPQVTGILKKIDFTEGQMVKAGDELVEIDPAPYQAALDQAKGTLAHDDAQLENAKVDLKRYQALATQNAISNQTLATQQALVRTDTGTVIADKAAVETAAINLGYCKITSPVAGRVGIRQVDVGNLMQPGSTTSIVVVTELHPISVLFTLPEDSISSVMERVGAGAKLSAEAWDRGQTTKLATGALATFDNEVDPTTGTVKLRATFDNEDNRLFPQQFVNIRLLVNTLTNQTVVPAAAIQRGSDGSFVYVAKPDHTVSVRNVTLGITDGDKVDVLSGLSPGESVVTDGADRLKDGAKISIPAATKIGVGHGGHKGHGGSHHRHRSQGGDSSGGSQ
jgi:multidrug efflux system membrane fusion protein